MKIIVITGGSRGIGASAAVECARRGLGVILTYNRNPDAAQAVVRKIDAMGGQAVALPLDVADASAFSVFQEAVLETLASTWGESRLDGLVNNAGYGLFNPLESVTEAQFDGLMNVQRRDAWQSRGARSSQGSSASANQRRPACGGRDVERFGCQCTAKCGHADTAPGRWPIDFRQS